MQEVDVSSENVDPPDWLPDPVRIARVVCHELGRERWAVSLLLCDENRIQELNRTYRRTDEPTDVLTFAADEQRGVDDTEAAIEGDVAVSLPTVERNAAAFEVPVIEEFLRVYVHALLHLAGYTHDGYDLSSANAMDHPMLGLQERLVKQLDKEFLS